jgi:hypothetical protein
MSVPAGVLLVCLPFICFGGDASPADGPKPPDTQRQAVPAGVQNMPESGLIACYPFDKDANDAAGKHHAANHHATLEAGGKVGGALAFDGKSSFLSLPAGLTAGLRQWSFSLWVKTKQSDAKPREQFWKNPTILGVATPGPGSGDFGITMENGRAAYYHGLSGEAVDTCVYTASRINDDEWHHLALTNDGAVIRFYVDGRLTRGEVLEHNGTLSAKGPSLQTGSSAELTGKSVFVGACNDTSEPGPAEHFYQGLVDDLRIWNRGLTAREVAALWTKVTGKVIAVTEPPMLPATTQAAGPAEATIELKNAHGLRWQLERRGGRWSLGTLLVHDKPVDSPLTSGILALNNTASRQISWPAVTEARQLDERSARFTGSEKIGDASFRFEVDVALMEDMPAATLVPRWSVDRDLSGFEVCLAYQGVGTDDWRVQSYPFAGNSAQVAIAPMRYCGVPGALVYRPDLSMVVLFAIDTRFDYLNPTTWTGKTGFHFANRRTAPQFRCGGESLTAGVRYEHPVQMLFSDAGDFTGAVKGIMENWIRLNRYEVDESLSVRTPQEAFQCTLEGRRKMASWKPGIGYEHHRGTPFVYVGNNPYIAFYEYRLYEMTGDPEWRKRAIEQIDFALKGQQADPSKPNYGVMHTSWYFRKQGQAEGFCSWDWSHDGYKVDLNVWMARYILETWQSFKQHEGLDRQEWYKAAVAAADWAVSQQNADGGLPQVVEIAAGRKSDSVVCGRALVGLPIIARITGDQRYLKVSEQMEKFLRSQVEGRFWYTGMHPDLPPEDFEQDSLYAVIEYWLNKHDRTGQQECLDRAVANAYYALLYWCPKQLSWVKSPTQCAHSEQQHFNQYSVYCYGNRKIECLARLARKTGNPLFRALQQRVMQMNFYVQVTEGPFMGSMTEAVCDPWLERGGGYEWRGSPYTSELVTDLMLQLMDLGLVKAGRP